MTEELAERESGSGLEELEVCAPAGAFAISSRPLRM
jgi:hypothetical protein